MRESSAAISLPSIPWFSALRSGYAEGRAVNEAGPAPAAAAPAQPAGLFSAAPWPVARGAAPSTAATLDYRDKCVKETDPLG